MGFPLSGTVFCFLLEKWSSPVLVPPVNIQAPVDLAASRRPFPRTFLSFGCSSKFALPPWTVMRSLGSSRFHSLVSSCRMSSGRESWLSRTNCTKKNFLGASLRHLSARLMPSLTPLTQLARLEVSGVTLGAYTVPLRIFGNSDATRSTRVSCVLPTHTVWTSGRGRQHAWHPCRAGSIVISENPQGLVTHSVHWVSCPLTRYVPLCWGVHCKKRILNSDATKITDLKRISVQFFTEFQTSIFISTKRSSRSI